MTKEQLIELINNRIPDGDLVNLRTTRDHVFQVTGIDDDCCVGLWNILIEEISEKEDAFDAAIKDAKGWKDSGLLKSEVRWD